MISHKFDILKNLTLKIGSGATPSGGQASYQENGISLIRSQNILDMCFSKDGLVFINDKQASKLNNVTVKKNDVLLNITGDSIARVCKVPIQILPARVNQHVSIIRANTKIDPDYLLYYLIFRKEYLLTISRVGGTRNALTKEAVEKIEIRLDDNDKKIASVLSNIDSKIELNNKINDNLEQMAKTIYDYCFVQFDFPDENGKPYKSSGGKMVYNDELKREIPDGWMFNKLGKVLKTYLGGTPSTKNHSFWNGSIPWMDSGEVANFPIISTESSISEEAILKSSTRLLKKGSVLLSITRHLRVNILQIDSCINQSIAGVEESDKLKNSYIYFSILNDINRLMTLRTGAQQPHINKEVVDSSPFIIPNKKVLENYYDRATPIFEKIFNNAKQNQELAKLRDWLLPMLMNGQVTVK